MESLSAIPGIVDHSESEIRLKSSFWTVGCILDKKHLCWLTWGKKRSFHTKFVLPSEYDHTDSSWEKIVLHLLFVFVDISNFFAAKRNPFNSLWALTPTWHLPFMLYRTFYLYKQLFARLQKLFHPRNFFLREKKSFASVTTPTDFVHLKTVTTS